MRVDVHDAETCSDSICGEGGDVEVTCAEVVGFRFCVDGERGWFFDASCRGGGCEGGVGEVWG